jgi:hypothetical protein
MGGGSQTSSTTQQTIDPAAAARMATVTERQQAMAEEQWSLAKQIYQPYEEQMVASNQALLAPNQQLMAAQLAEGTRDIQMDQPLKDLLREQKMGELTESAPLVSKFYEEAGKGVDVGARKAQAEADVVSEYANVPESVRRELSRTGTALTGARHENMLKSIALDRARAIAGARGTAGRAAETEGFAKLATAMQARSGVSPTMSTTPTDATGVLNVGNYALNSPLSSAGGLYANVTQGLGDLTRPTSKGESSGWSFNFL